MWCPAYAAIPSARTGSPRAASCRARPLDERTRKRHPLALAARELVDPPPAVALQAHKGQHLSDALDDFGVGRIFLPQTEADVTRHGKVREQRIVLKHHVHRPPMWLHSDDILAVKKNVPLAGRLETGEHAQ